MTNSRPSPTAALAVLLLTVLLAACGRAAPPERPEGAPPDPRLDPPARAAAANVPLKRDTAD